METTENNFNRTQERESVQESPEEDFGFGSGGVTRHNYTGKKQRSSFGKGRNSIGKGRNSFGKGRQSFGKGRSSFGKGRQSFGKGRNSFGKGRNSFGKGLYGRNSERQQRQLHNSGDYGGTSYEEFEKNYAKGHILHLQGFDGGESSDFAFQNRAYVGSIHTLETSFNGPFMEKPPSYYEAYESANKLGYQQPSVAGMGALATFPILNPLSGHRHSQRIPEDLEQRGQLLPQQQYPGPMVPQQQFPGQGYQQQQMLPDHQNVGQHVLPGEPNIGQGVFPGQQTHPSGRRSKRKKRDVPKQPERDAPERPSIGDPALQQVIIL